MGVQGQVKTADLFGIRVMPVIYKFCYRKCKTKGKKRVSERDCKIRVSKILSNMKNIYVDPNLILNIAASQPVFRAWLFWSFMETQRIFTVFLTGSCQIGLNELYSLLLAPHSVKFSSMWSSTVMLNQKIWKSHWAEFTSYPLLQ